MRCVILLTAVALTCVSCAGPRVVEDFYENGAAKTNGQLQSGKQSGEWTYFYDDGTVKARGPWKKDYQDGAWTYYYRNGTKKHQGSYQSKLRVGLWEYWYDNGNLYSRGQHVADRQDGLWEYFDNDASVFATGCFQDGVKHGAWVWASRLKKGRENNGMMYQGQRVGPWLIDGHIVDKGIPATCAQRETSQNGITQWSLFDKNAQHVMALMRDGQGRMLATIDFSESRYVAYAENGTLRAVYTNFGKKNVQDTVRCWHDNGQLAIDGDEYWTADGVAIPELDSNAVDKKVTAVATLKQSTDAIFSRINALPKKALLKKKRIATVSADELIISDVDEPSLTPIVHIETMWTKYEEAKAGRLVDLYLSALPQSDNRYSRGAEERWMNPKWMKVPLPQTRFFTYKGSIVDLKDFTGKKNVCVVIMRGFAGQVCVYCSTQTRALAEKRAEFAAKDCELVIVYPGPAESIPSFMTAVASVGGDAQGLEIVLDVNLTLVKALGIVKELSKPASFIIDKTGTVIYAYEGKNMGDRPSAKELLIALDKASKNG